MDNDQIREHIALLLQPALLAMDDAVKQLKAVEQRLENGLDARLRVVDQMLTERHARQVNALAVNDARFAAVIAYLTNDDVQQAFVRTREIFRNRHPAEFDAALWQVEPDWLTALRRRDSGG